MYSSAESTLSNKFKKTILIFIPVFLCVLCILFFIFIIQAYFFKKKIEDNEKHVVEILKEHIVGHMQIVTSDLHFLKDYCDLHEVDENTLLSNKTKSELNREFFSFSSCRKIYDQIRILDKSGMEIIRINYKNNQAEIVDKNRLQNKQKRYYFIDTISLNEDEIFVSPMDLNIEYGKIEIPRKPMIRFGTPLFNEQGKKYGVILLNYFGDTVLNYFNSLNQINDSNYMLVNHEGYWLKDITPENEWGFMYTEKSGKKIQNKFPGIWEEILSNEEGIIKTKDGQFTFLTVYPLQEGQISSTGSNKAFGESEKLIESKGYFWKIISHVPKSVLYKDEFKMIKLFLLILVIIAVLLIIGIWLFVNLILARKQAEKIMYEEKRFRSFFELGIVGMAYTSFNYEWLEVNEQLSKILGYEKNEIVGKNWINFVYKDDIERSKEYFYKLISGENDSCIMDIRFIHKTGRIIFTIMSLRGILNKNEEIDYFVTLVQDITVRKLAEESLKSVHNELYISREQLRNYSIYLQQIIEQERKKLSRELHDELGHLLTTVKLYVSQMIDKKSRKERNLFSGAVIQLIDDSIQFTKKLSLNLRSSVLDNFGIAEALKDYVKEFQKKTAINCELKISPKTIDLDKNKSLILYRIVQESLTNIIRHSKADNVKISLIKNKKNIFLNIIDNGRGVTNKEISDPQSLGIIGMRERIHSCEGEFEIKGKKDAGTIISITIPYNKIKENVNAENYYCR